jgi:hypothetical protein
MAIEAYWRWIGKILGLDSGSSIRHNPSLSRRSYHRQASGAVLEPWHAVTLAARCGRQQISKTVVVESVSGVPAGCLWEDSVFTTVPLGARPIA